VTAPAAAPVAPSWARFVAALEAAECRPRVRGTHADARCPAHDDRAPSLSADWRPATATSAGRVLYRCQAGCDQRAVREALRLNPADLYDGQSPDFASGPPAARQPRRAAPRPSPASSAPRAVPRPRSGDPGAEHEHRGPVEARHVYRDAAGVIRGSVDRTRCADPACPSIAEKGKPGHGKFTARRPDGRAAAGASDGFADLLYRLPEVAAAIAAGRPVYLCEGEGDADAVAAAGACGTSSFGGATRAIRPAYVAELAGADVIVCADNDPMRRQPDGRLVCSGYTRAAEWRELLTGTARSVRVAKPAIDRPGADVSDHLAAGLSLADLIECDPAAELERAAAELAALDDAAAADVSSQPAAPLELAPARDETSAAAEPVKVPRIGPKPRPVEGSPGWQFIPPGPDGTPGAVERLMGRGEDRGMEPVIMSCPLVTERLVTAPESTNRDRRHYTLRWGPDEATVSYADLISGDAWDKFPDAIGTGDKPVRAALANVVMTQGKALGRTLAATRTGWHEDADGRRYYLRPDGRTFPPGRPVRLIGAPAKLAEAAAPRGQATDAEIRQALADIAAHGRFAGLLGLAAGARSFGQSIRPVLAALGMHGDPNAGKTLAGWHGRSLLLTSQGGRIEGFPPLPTKSFAATKTDLEFAANFEADMPALFEDLALPGNASAIEVREANGKLEALIRPLANQDEIRGRRSRDLMPGPANYVRSIPVITAERMPPTMMESLYRRAVAARLHTGQVDTLWYAANSAPLLTPLRAIGDRLIKRLYDLGDDAAARLGEVGAAAYGVLGSAIGNAAWLDSTPAMAGVIDGAAAILGGLWLVADVVPGIDGAELAEPVAAYLADALAEQASTMTDRHDESGSLAGVVGLVLTRAMASRRAHVCDAHGRPEPLIPGLVPSEQGVIRAGLDVWEGSGVALYWLPDHGGIGVRSEALHGLLIESRDPRAAGLTPRGLTAALLREGLSIPSSQKGRAGATYVFTAKAQLVILRPDVVSGGTGDSPVELSPTRSSDANCNNCNNCNAAGQGAVVDLPAAPGEDICNAAGQSAAPAASPAAGAEGAEDVTSVIADIADVPGRPAMPRPAPSPASSRAARFAAPAVVIDADSAWLARTDQLEPVEAPELPDLAAVLAWAGTLRLGVEHAAGMPDDAAVVILPGMAARLGLPAAPPDPKSKAAREHQALGAVRAAGWNLPALRSWMAPYRRGVNGSTVRLWLPGWDDDGECPMWGDGVPAVDLAYRLGLFAERLGIGWRLTGGITGVDLARTFRRRKLRLEAADPPKPALTGVGHALHWSRKPTSDEAGLSWVHAYDGNGAYLAAYNTPVNVGGWRHAEGPPFDPELPGYWLIDAPAWADRLLPDLFDPTGRAAATRYDGPRWFMTPTLALAAELGYEIRPREAYLPAGDYGRYWEAWYRRARDARSALMASADADDQAVLAALKVVWHATHSQVGIKSQGSRKDHDQTMISAYAANLTRRLIKVAELGQRWPLAIGTDAVVFASDDPDPVSACPVGMVIGAGLGEFKAQGTLPMADAAPLLGSARSDDVNQLLELAKHWADGRGGNTA
jgi:hypothetical protein